MLERYRLLSPFSRFEHGSRWPNDLFLRVLFLASFVRSFLLASEDFASKRRPFTIRHGRHAA